VAKVLGTLTIAATVLFSGLRDARAWTCGGGAAVIVPGTLDVAPTNTHVWMYIPQSFVRGCDERTKQCADAVRFELRTAPAGRDPGTVVPSDVRRTETDHSGSDPFFVVEMIPKADLQPATRHEIWSVGIQAPRRQQFWGTLRTGKGRDTKPPTWSGATKVTPIVHKQSAHVATIVGSGGLNVFGPRASDAEGRVLYAAWKGTAATPIDFSRPPDGYAYETGLGVSNPRSESALVVLGWPGGCTPPNFAVPEVQEVRIGLRAVDLAGNVSAPSEHRVKLR